MTVTTDEDHSRSARPTSRIGPRARRTAVLLALSLAAAGAYFGYDAYRVGRLAASVRRAFSTRQFDEARRPLDRWREARPRSGEPEYYRAWLALVDDRPAEAVDAVERAGQRGFDPSRLQVLKAIYEARAGRINPAESVLRRAFDRKLDPRPEVARELARIYLTTYRLTQAAQVVGRYRELVPSDPQSYLWNVEIGLRTNATPATLIGDYRAALERDPGLDSARLGLADQLRMEQRYDEAEAEYRTYLQRHPTDAAALVGLGRNRLVRGDVAGAAREFEAALAADPKQADALRELAQLELRSGRPAQARRRFELLTQLQPFDHEVRYSYAQALKLAGEPDRARREAERATRLREEENRVIDLGKKIRDDPRDVASRLEVARWMLEHGQAEEGLKWTREIFRIDPRHAPTHSILADYYTGRGEKGLANYHRMMASGGAEAR